MVGGYSFALTSSTAPPRRSASRARPSSRSSTRPRWRTATRRRSIVLDAPDQIDQGPGQDAWKPENYETRIPRPCTLRIGLELSLNTMTVRLAQDVGMPKIVASAMRLRRRDDWCRCWPWRWAPARPRFSADRRLRAFVNGGQQGQADLIELVQDREGKPSGAPTSAMLRAARSEPMAEPGGARARRRPAARSSTRITAYQITSMLRGRRPARHGAVGMQFGRTAAGRQDRHHQRVRVAWFVGFTPRHRGRRLRRLRRQPHRWARQRPAASRADLHRLHASRRLPAGQAGLRSACRRLQVDAASTARPLAREPATRTAIREAFKPGTGARRRYSAIGIRRRRHRARLRRQPTAIEPR